MTGETGAERRCQLPKPARGAEASTAQFAARSCTSGVDRRSRTKHEASPGNECRRRGPAEGCSALLLGWGVTGRERPRLDGKRRTPASPAITAGEGAEPPSRKRGDYRATCKIQLRSVRRKKNVPQGLKPHSFQASYGTTQVVPFKFCDRRLNFASGSIDCIIWPRHIEKNLRGNDFRYAQIPILLGVIARTLQEKDWCTGWDC